MSNTPDMNIASSYIEKPTLDEQQCKRELEKTLKHGRNDGLSSNKSKEKLNTFLAGLRNSCAARRIPLISQETEKLLRDILQEKKPRQCLEIGSAVGYSSIVIASTIAEWGGQLVSFEVSLPDHLEAQENIRKAGYTNTTLHLFDITKSETLDMVLPTQYDFVFIDAQKSQYGTYLEKIQRHLSPENIILLDDVVKYQNKVQPLYEVLKKTQINYEILPSEPGDGVMKLVNVKPSSSKKTESPTSE